MPLTAKFKPWLKHHIRKLPMLEKVLRFLMAKSKLLDWKHRHHRRWFADSPKDELRFQYDLPPGASILDVGGYNGDFAARFIELYNANVTIFEPVKFQYLHIQFHLNVPDAKKQYRKLAERLQHTHRLQWRYPFVWESWQRRGIHKTRTGSNG